MRPKPYGAQNTKFLEYETSSLIPLTSSELLKFENRTSVIIEISRFSGHRCPGINEGVFDCSKVLWKFETSLSKDGRLILQAFFSGSINIP